MAEYHREEEAASQTEGHGEQHGQRQEIALILCREDEVDEHEAQQEDDGRRVGCLRFLTRQSTIVEGVACGEHIGTHFLTGLDGFTRRVSSCYCCSHGN